MKFLKKIQKELTRTMKIKYLKSRFKCESNSISSIHGYSSNSYNKISLTNFMVKNELTTLILYKILLIIFY